MVVVVGCVCVCVKLTSPMIAALPGPQGTRGGRYAQRPNGPGAQRILCVRAKPSEGAVLGPKAHALRPRPSPADSSTAPPPLQSPATAAREARGARSRPSSLGALPPLQALPLLACRM